MVCRTHIPRPPLSDFVEVFWQYDGLDPSHARERCLPTGTMEIVVNPSSRTGGGRSGQMSPWGAVTSTRPIS
jgi:hypothetical protein